MLKNQPNRIIIASEMRWDIMNKNILVSTAFLCSIWNNHNTDLFKIEFGYLLASNKFLEA